MIWLSVTMRFAAAKFCADARGATSIEYGLVAAGIAVVIVVVVFAIGDSLENLFNPLQVAVGVCEENNSASAQGLIHGKGHRCG